ncbi:hypothetical protein GGH12_003403 [Coemansia sp. RSA 1822]|nr:hypothetical protein LPJ76_002146 [Coemansia sp. RSA 638]KAJ2542111.1 hypothetical protein GGF49_003119 [Coemansia sp. RSA 1853]KAJ2562219.1 hypothetical protein GGH12_003403 [Coemansia sp. RSA 1822]
MSGDEVAQVGQVQRPTFIAIHARDSKATILFISSGIQQCMGYRPEDLVSKPGGDFIADTSNEDYPKVYANKTANTDAVTEENNADDDASAYVMYVNGTTPSGVPVLHKITSFMANSCVVCVGVAFPEVPFIDRRELEVKMLDKAMQSLNVTREREQIERRRDEVTKQGGQGAMFCARSKRVKAIMVLELPEIADIEVEQSGRRPNGPLVAFCTASIAQIVDADNTDLHNYPFLKLVAPEHLVHVSSYFELMSKSNNVLFEKFSLLQRPHVIEGDIFVSDEENMRVVVECMGAAVNDGVAILMRKLRVQPAPKKDKLGNYIRPVQEPGSDQDELSLLDLLSTEPETTDVPDCWSQLR